MKIKILGAHNIETRRYRCTSLLIDDVIAVDAGALTGGLNGEEQLKLKAVFLTHQRYDHLRDIPALGMTLFLHSRSIDIYGSRQTRDVLATHMLNDIVYPDFFTRPEEKPTLRFNELQVGRRVTINGYSVLPAAVSHSVPALGYEIASAEGRRVFFTADTGHGLEAVWQATTPHLIIAELTAPDRFRDFATKSGHLTPSFLEQELKTFHRLHGYLPEVLLVHMNPIEQAEIRAEIRAVSRRLGASIRLAREGMTVDV
ncbi:MAG: MBL fold metallo-hydrolase [Dehalococcoidales bacterium]|nr:MBL fold metallo-hydrolase [Dehalococcoidales bacterium]